MKTSYLLEFNEDQQMFHFNNLENGVSVHPRQEPNTNEWQTLCEVKGDIFDVYQVYTSLNIKMNKKYTFKELITKINNNGKEY